MYEVDIHAEAGVMSPEDVAAGLFDAWNEHDAERILSFYAPHYEGIDVGQATPEHGLEGKRQAALRYFDAYPDLHFTIEKTVVQGDCVVTIWTAKGTHLGYLMGIPPTGRTICVRGTSTLDLAEGKIVSATYIWDVAGMLREIGLLPEL
jgi:steroid delta-isomerase-like uncharacterized protein